MKNEGNAKETKHRGHSYMRAVVFVCSVMVFALVLGTFFFLQQFQPQHNGLVPIEDSTDVNEPDLQRPGENAAQDSASDDDAGYVPGEVLVVVEPGTSVESINEALASFDFVATKDVSNQNFDAGFVVVALAEGANAEHSATTLSLSGLRAQPNYVYTIAEGCDADPLATLLAASFNGGENDYLQSQATVSINDSKHGEQWALDSVDAYRAWSVEKCGNKGGSRVSIAVIDTGIDIDHEDLEPNIKATYLTEVKSGSTVTREGSTQRSDADDRHGHGTHVSGIAAGATDNGTGIAGVSYNAGIVAIKATTSETSQSFTTATLSDGYNWLFAQRPDGKTNAEYYNVRVVNMSVGGYQSGGLNRDEVLAQRIREAYAGKSGNKTFPSIITVAAAGNYGTKDSLDNVVPLPFDVIPGDYEYCLTVMNLAKEAGWDSSNNAVALSGGSNYNPPGTHFKNISAPGTNILSTVRTGGYGLNSGTSMASPLVAGIAALVISENPTLNARQVTDIIEATANDLEAQGWDERTGYGEIDAYHALQVTSATLGEGITISYKDTHTLKMSYGDGTGWETSGSTDDWDWTVSDESVVDVQPADDKKSMSVTGKKPGTATITATLKDADGNATTDIALTKKVTVAKLDLTKANIVTTGSYEYTGSAIAPTPIVSYGGSQLEKGIDYTVSYENNINASTSSSKAQVIVSGIGNCTGSVCASFAISPTSLAAATLSACGSYTYTGNAITPTPSVTLNGFGTLTKGKDFDYKYSDNQNAGANARVSVVGTGNFTGESAWTSFTIARCDLSAATISITSQSYEGRPVTPIPKVTINGKVLEKDRDYKVLGYANNNSAGTGKVTIEGINNYSGCREASFTIASPVRTSMITIDETPTYTGSALKPHITVRDGSKVLREGTDYSLSYANNVSAGVDRASVTVTGKGNYAGTATKKFTIAQRPVSAATVTVAAQTYTGKALTPKPTVKVGSTTLREGTDYTLSYGGNVNVGTGSVTVVGKGNYTGSRKATFRIEPKPGASTGGGSGSSTAPSGAAMYRLYNPNSGEHFYTASAHERDSLRRAGWKYEGVGWTAPATSRTPVYRLYSGTDHHYTTSAAERDMLVRAGWRYEGVGWYSDDAKGTPLYRQFNPNVNPAAPRNNSGSHNYTTSRAEHDHLVSAGWRGEGIGWYGM